MSARERDSAPGAYMEAEGESFECGTESENDFKLSSRE